MSQPQRQRILDALRDGPMTAYGIASMLDVSKSTATKLLGSLRERGLVQATRHQSSLWTWSLVQWLDLDQADVRQVERRQYVADLKEDVMRQRMMQQAGL